MILLVGKSAAGKDTVAERLEERGLRSVISHTTRPRRGADDTRHVFVDDEEADILIRDAVATTTINGYRYFATRDDMRAADVYVIDPNGIDELLANLPDMEFRIVYIDADDEERRRKAIARADDPDEAAKVFDERDADESPEFDAFRRRITLAVTDGRVEAGFPANAASFAICRNGYRPEDIDRIAIAATEG